MSVNTLFPSMTDRVERAMKWAGTIDVTDPSQWVEMPTVTQFIVPLYEKMTTLHGVDALGFAKLIVEAMPCMSEKDLALLASMTIPVVSKVLDCISVKMMPHRKELLCTYEAWPTGLCVMVAEVIHADLFELDPSIELSALEQGLVKELKSCVGHCDTMTVPHCRILKRKLLAAPLECAEEESIKKYMDPVPGFLEEAAAMRKINYWSDGVVAKVLDASNGKLVLVADAVCKALMHDTDMDEDNGLHRNPFAFKFINVSSKEEAISILEQSIKTIAEVHAEHADDLFIDVRPDCTVTVNVWKKNKFRFDLHMFHTLEHAILSMDFSNLRCGFDGRRVHMSASCGASLNSLMVMANPMQTSAFIRAIRQAKYGFAMCVPLTDDAHTCLRAFTHHGEKSRTRIARGCRSLGTRMLACYGMTFEGPNTTVLEGEVPDDFSFDGTLFDFVQDTSTCKLAPAARECVAACIKLHGPTQPRSKPFYDSGFVECVWRR